MAHDDLLFQYLLRLGDSPLVLAQRLGERVGKGPAIGADIAFVLVDPQAPDGRFVKSAFLQAKIRAKLEWLRAQDRAAPDAGTGAEGAGENSTDR